MGVGQISLFECRVVKLASYVVMVIIVARMTTVGVRRVTTGWTSVDVRRRRGSGTAPVSGVTSVTGVLLLESTSRAEQGVLGLLAWRGRSLTMTLTLTLAVMVAVAVAVAVAVR